MNKKRTECPEVGIAITEGEDFIFIEVLDEAKSFFGSCQQDIKIPLPVCNLCENRDSELSRDIMTGITLCEKCRNKFEK